MEALEAILTRRSIREYATQSMHPELIMELLAAAMQAPSAGNQQAGHFILITERKHLFCSGRCASLFTDAENRTARHRGMR